MQYAPNRNPAPLFSPFFSGKTEKKGPPEARQKRPRRNEPPQATSLILCARFFLSKPQTEFAVWVFVQICDNLSVSASPSQHPYPFCPFGTFPPDRGNRPLEGEPRNAHRRKYSKAGDDLSVSLRLPAPLGGEPCGEKSPPRGARGLLFTVSVWFYPQKTLS